MKLHLIRTDKTEISTIDELTVDGNFECFILEDKDRGLDQSMPIAVIQQHKVFGKTAIPKGTYDVVISWSNRFKMYLPLIINVPGFEGVRIHSGNTSDHTEGCVLVGYAKDVLHNRILNSRAAIAELYMLITEKIKTEKVYITISKMEIVA